MLYKREQTSTAGISDLKNASHGHQHALAAAIHEAGHAVAAWRFGFRVIAASLDINFIKTFRADDAVPASPMVAIIPSVRARAAIERGSIRTKDEKTQILNLCAHYMAGPCAEYYFAPASYDRGWGSADWMMIGEILTTVEKNEARSKKLFNSARLHVDSFVREHLAEIRAFAQELDRKTTLLEPEINSLMHEITGIPAKAG